MILRGDKFMNFSSFALHWKQQNLWAEATHAGLEVFNRIIGRNKPKCKRDTCWSSIHIPQQAGFTVQNGSKWKPLQHSWGLQGLYSPAIDRRKYLPAVWIFHDWSALNKRHQNGQQVLPWEPAWYSNVSKLKKKSTVKAIEATIITDTQIACTPRCCR